MMIGTAVFCTDAVVELPTFTVTVAMSNAV